jgi:hypothetical protein
MQQSRAFPTPTIRHDPARLILMVRHLRMTTGARLRLAELRDGSMIGIGVVRDEQLAGTLAPPPCVVLICAGFIFLFLPPSEGCL